MNERFLILWAMLRNSAVPWDLYKFFQKTLGTYAHVYLFHGSSVPSGLLLTQEYIGFMTKYLLRPILTMVLSRLMTTFAHHGTCWG
jgi:hypothetical protein